MAATPGWGERERRPPRRRHDDAQQSAQPASERGLHHRRYECAQPVRRRDWHHKRVQQVAHERGVAALDQAVRLARRRRLGRPPETRLGHHGHRRRSAGAPASTLRQRRPCRAPAAAIAGGGLAGHQPVGEPEQRQHNHQRHRVRSGRPQGQLLAVRHAPWRRGRHQAHAAQSEQSGACARDYPPLRRRAARARSRHHALGLSHQPHAGLQRL